MKKEVTVSVGISAYNEEKNIANVLTDIINQKQNGWKLAKVLIYSDGSSDSTVKTAQTVASPAIKVVYDKKRKGKVYRIQEIFNHATGDILVIFDADIKIKSRSVITNLVKAFVKNDKAVLVGGNAIAHPPKNFFQRAVYSTFKVFYESRIHIQNGNNLFACVGSCLAIRTRFARKIVFPKISNEDTYLYFTCKARGYDFIFVPSAVVYYKLPNTLSDYLAQVFRSNPEAVQLKLREYFGDLVFEEYKRGALFYAKNIVRVFLSDPLPVAYIIIVNLLCRPFFRFLSKSDKATWDSIKSTK